MRRPVLALTLTAAMTFAALGAQAHPGSKILTLGGGAERGAMTPGMTYESINGVHVFKGARALAGDEPALASGDEKRHVEIEIEKRIYVWRRIRYLRTQGFYSGDRYPSRRFTHGFYSGY
jgi:hypothetical protein